MDVIHVKHFFCSVDRLPMLAEICEGFNLLLKTLLHLMEFNPNFIYLFHLPVYKFTLGIHFGHYLSYDRDVYVVLLLFCSGNTVL
jgi:hypothetical protein